MDNTAISPDTIFLFQGINATEVHSLLERIPEAVSFAKGEVVYTRRRFRHALGVLLSGRAEVYRTEGGRHVLMNRLGPGDSFGAAALYGGGEEYVTEIRAATACEILFLSQETVSEWMRRDYRVAENYIRFLSGRIRFLNRRIAGFTGGAADRRLARYLAEQAGENGRTRLPGSMTALASALNIGRSSLYRSLDALTETGLIRRAGREIEIVDIGRLRDAAGVE